MLCKHNEHAAGNFSDYSINKAVVAQPLSLYVICKYSASGVVFTNHIDIRLQHECILSITHMHARTHAHTYAHIHTHTRTHTLAQHIHACTHKNNTHTYITSS